ncbi:MAG: class I SAM-dependent methyltransferase [Chthoniobacteraceae bacterium]|jgi:ubiquinone/menaquinone biosynthesis C-methylase UbiE
MLSDPVFIPEEVAAQVGEAMGQYFSKINGASPETLTGDMLNPSKAVRAHEVLCRYVNPQGKRILEIGSGYGITLITWTKQFGLDVTGAEPEGEGFADTIGVSRRLCEINSVPPERIVVSQGERLPFADASFDIVYSCNVIDHCNDAAKFLREAMRVLKPGGILHFETPNFTSYFEGHYYVPMPPLLFGGLLPWWVKSVFGRDPAFARTLRTEINPMWLRKTIAVIAREQPAKIVSLGEEVFRERLKSPFDFQHKAVQKIIGPVIGSLQRLNFGSLAANLFIMLQAHYPIYLTVEKAGQ